MRSKDFARLFGQAVREHRKAKGLTQEELAEKADIASKMVSLIERFERNPSLNVAESLALGLEIPLSQLVKSAEDLRKKPKSKRS